VSDQSDEIVARSTAQYPPADITATEFETFVAELLGATSPLLDDLKVTLHEAVPGVDGEYDFDATIRYELAGMEFLVLVECKRHKNPIKRELVQVLYQKVQSVGAHKGAMFSTAPYQRGALEFANRHGISLVTVTEGRFIFEARSANPPPALSREEAFESLGLPTFVGHSYSGGNGASWTNVTTLGTDRSEDVAEQILGVAGSDGL
jgi:hypothetical protein